MNAVFTSNVLVCRGGSCTADRFAGGSGVSIDADGKLRGVSVNSGPGAALEELAATIPNRRIGVSTVAEIEANGATVVAAPAPNNRYHCIMGGITPQQAEQLFTPTVPNPNLP